MDLLFSRAEQESEGILSFVLSQVRVGAEVTGSTGIRLGLAETLTVAPRKMRERRPHLPIDVFAVFGGEHVQPLGTDTAVENALR